MKSNSEGRQLVAFYEGKEPDERGRYLDKSLTILGHDTLAHSLFRALHDVYDEERGTGRESISARTFTFWQNALRG